MNNLAIRLLFGPAGRRLLNPHKLVGKLGPTTSGESHGAILPRQFSVGPRLGAKPLVGWKHGHQDDPMMNPMDGLMPGQEVCPEWVYRSGRDYPKHYGWLERGYTHFLSAFLWFWFFYHVYWDYGHLVGEWYIPALEEFTDAELGIPPDDAPDPEYWGYQQPHTAIES